MRSILGRPCASTRANQTAPPESCSTSAGFTHWAGGIASPFTKGSRQPTNGSFSTTTPSVPRRRPQPNPAMPLRIGFDMDGVLADFGRAFHEVETRLFGRGEGLSADEPAREEGAQETKARRAEYAGLSE